MTVLAILEQAGNPGEIKNFGSHFQDGPYGGGSIGDEKARWEEFKAFPSQFTCKKCSRAKFQRPFTPKKPLCSHECCTSIRTPNVQCHWMRLSGQ
jgi:hypothetical protein